METLNSVITENQKVMLVAVLAQARAARELALIEFARQFAHLQQQLGLAVSEQIRQTVLNDSLNQAIAFLHQNVMLAMRDHAITTACQNQFLSSLSNRPWATKPARRLKLVSSPSDAQDLGEIG